MSMANVTLVGKLGAAPETFYTQGGMLIVTLSVATTKYKKGQDGQGQEITLWHTVKVFSKTAERCEKYLQKGSGVVIEGELSYRDYETSDGQKRKATEIRINSAHPKSHALPTINPYHNHPKIRIGYFSADFKIHPVTTLTAELYEVHNREHFEIHAFSYGPDTNDEMNLRIKAGVDHFHNVEAMSHKDIALLSRSLEIDIAVDLTGYTAKSRIDIFAMSVAPIQLSYIGFLGTMGADYYDYLIADPVMIPKENQKHYCWIASC